jgi:hypothetical protein
MSGRNKDYKLKTTVRGLHKTVCKAQGGCKKNKMELTIEQIKKLKSIEKRLIAANNDIRKMGFDVYLANDRVNIMCGPSHDDSPFCRPIIENSIWSFTLRGWSGGDW